jgi:hypothetical protein
MKYLSINTIIYISLLFNKKNLTIILNVYYITKKKSQVTYNVIKSKTKYVI